MGRLHVVGWIGVILYPGYFLVWAYLIPLPYESLTLRLVGAAACAPLLFEDQLRKRPAFLGGYWLISMIYCLPFFFIYMTLRNEYHLFWCASFFSAVVILILFFPNLRASLTVLAIGTAAAVGTYFLQFGALPAFRPYPASVPLTGFENVAGGIFVFVFVVAATSLLNFHRRSIERASLDAVQRWADAILHQTLSPLNSMQHQLEGIRIHLTRKDLIEVVDRALGQARSTMETAKRMMAFAVPLDREQESESASISDLVLDAVDSYPYGIVGPSESKELVRVSAIEDFEVLVPPDLFAQALHNLINNAMHAILKAARGAIEIEARRGRRYNRLVFRDTATGIPLEEIPYIFEGFYTNRRGGFGQGLAYCREFMLLVGGRIECVARTSGPAPFTEFRLEFPVA